MKTEFKYIRMVEEDVSGKTRRFNVKGEGDVYLGQIKWYGAFRKYSFFPEANTVYEPTCLSDLSEFCRDLTKDHYERKKEAKKYYGSL